jgi:coenzyme PQQ precursor peptide PqqA
LRRLEVSPVSRARLAHWHLSGFATLRDGVHSGPRRKGTSRRFGRSTAEADCAGKEVRMWKKPTIVEIAVGLEINSYACAALD